MVRRVGRLAAAFALALLLPGCSQETGRNLPKAPVSGVVKYKEALPDGQIVFQHQSGEMTAIRFGADGKYTAQVPQGPNKVMLQSHSSSQREDQPGHKTMEIFTSRIPPRYSQFATSPLEIVVKDGENAFDINLVE